MYGEHKIAFSLVPLFVRAKGTKPLFDVSRAGENKSSEAGTSELLLTG